jgi:hypothetical protein
LFQIETLMEQVKANSIVIRSDDLSDTGYQTGIIPPVNEQSPGSVIPSPGQGSLLSCSEAEVSPDVKPVLDSRECESRAKLTIPSFQWNALEDQVNLLRDAFHGEEAVPSTVSSSGVSSNAYSRFWEPGSGFPFFFNQVPTTTTIEEALRRIPPKPICDYLFEKYLTVCSNVFHIFYEPRIEDGYQTLWQDLEQDQLPEISLSFLALVFAMFNSAVLYMGDGDLHFNKLKTDAEYAENDSADTLSRRFREVALRCLVADNFLVNYSVTTIQALLVILDSILHVEGDDGPCWPIFGMICNMAISLGCNADLTDLGLSLIEREERHRCWSGILLIEILQACLFGRPVTQRALSSPDCLPLNINDFNLKLGDAIPAGPDELTHMTFILTKVKIGGQFTDIYNRMRNNKGLTYDEVLGLDRAVAESMKDWDIPYRANKGYTQFSFAKYDILRNLLDQNLLLLHRPYFKVHKEARIKCIKSATAIVRRINNFCRDERYKPFMIYTRGLGIFYCFHAAVVLAIAAAQEWSERSPVKSTNSAMFENFEIAVNIIVTMAPQSRLASRTSEVLIRLRDTLRRLVYESPQEVSMGGTELPMGAYPGGGVNEDVLDYILNSSVAQDMTQWIGPHDVNWAEWDALAASILGSQGGLRQQLQSA